MNKTILIVDKNTTNLHLLEEFLLKNDFKCVVASDYETLDSVVKSGTIIHLVLMDISGFDVAIWEYTRLFNTRQVPILILSAVQNPLLQKESIKHGAKGIIKKPVNLKDFLELLTSMTNESQ